MRGGIEIDSAELVFAVDFQPIGQGGEAEIEAVGFDHACLDWQKLLERGQSLSYPPSMASAVTNYEEIENSVLDLPFPDRSRLATRILESLDDDDAVIGPKWRDELNRRVRDIDEGRTELIPHDEVWKRVNDRFDTDFKA